MLQNATKLLFNSTLGDHVWALDTDKDVPGLLQPNLVLGGLTLFHYLFKSVDIDAQLVQHRLITNAQATIIELVSQLRPDEFVYDVYVANCLNHWRAGAADLMLDMNFSHPCIDTLLFDDWFKYHRFRLKVLSYLIAHRDLDSHKVLFTSVLPFLFEPANKMTLELELPNDIDCLRFSPMAVHIKDPELLELADSEV